MTLVRIVMTLWARLVPSIVVRGPTSVAPLDATWLRAYEREAAKHRGDR
jgi:hypothetical protein